MKSFAKIALALSAALSLSAFAQESTVLTGTVHTSVSSMNVDNGYPNGTIGNLGLRLNLPNKDKVSVDLTTVDAWGGKAGVLGLGYTWNLSDEEFLTLGAAASDKDKVSIKERVNAVMNWKVLPARNLIVGAGVDYYTMRGGSSSTSVLAQGVYYVPGMPLVLQGDIRLSRAEFNGRWGNRFGVAATYGRVGDWTVGLRADTGRVHYELVRAPGAIADYNSDHVAVTYNHWITRDFGLTLGASAVRNQYYNSDTVRAGIFLNF